MMSLEIGSNLDVILRQTDGPRLSLHAPVAGGVLLDGRADDADQSHKERFLKMLFRFSLRLTSLT